MDFDPTEGGSPLLTALGPGVRVAQEHPQASAKRQGQLAQSSASGVRSRLGPTRQMAMDQTRTLGLQAAYSFHQKREGPHDEPVPAGANVRGLPSRRALGPPTAGLHRPHSPDLGRCRHQRRSHQHSGVPRRGGRPSQQQSSRAGRPSSRGLEVAYC